MSDLIKREDAIKAMADYLDLLGVARRYAKSVINKVPSAEPKQGEGKMMSEREKYIERLWDSCDCNEGVLHYTIMDIAWSLRNIAESLMEMNGYVDPHKYMEGVDDE